MKILLFDFGTIINGDRDEITKFNDHRNRTDGTVFLVAGDVTVEDYRSKQKMQIRPSQYTEWPANGAKFQTLTDDEVSE